MALIKYIHENTAVSVKFYTESDKFEIQRVVRQGDTVSPKLCMTLLEYVLKKYSKEKGINVNGERLTHLRLADDIVLMADREDDARWKPRINAGRISVSKTQIVTNRVLS